MLTPSSWGMETMGVRVTKSYAAGTYGCELCTPPLRAREHQSGANFITSQKGLC